MTPLSKLHDIMGLCVNFDGTPGKLEPIARQIDLLGSMIDENTDVYKELVKTRKIILNPKKIDKVLEYLVNAENYLIHDEK